MIVLFHLHESQRLSENSTGFIPISLKFYVYMRFIYKSEPLVLTLKAVTLLPLDTAMTPFYFAALNVTTPLSV
jgi:hypothetical protein